MEARTQLSCRLFAVIKNGQDDAARELLAAHAALRDITFPSVDDLMA